MSTRKTTELTPCWCRYWTVETITCMTVLASLSEKNLALRILSSNSPPLISSITRYTDLSSSYTCKISYLPKSTKQSPSSGAANFSAPKPSKILQSTHKISGSYTWVKSPLCAQAIKAQHCTRSGVVPFIKHSRWHMWSLSRSPSPLQLLDSQPVVLYIYCDFHSNLYPTSDVWRGTFLSPATLHKATLLPPLFTSPS